MQPRPDLQEVLDAFDAADRAAESLAARLSDSQFQWQPNGGAAWSVAQCLDHLTTTNLQYGGAIRQALEAARRNDWTTGAAISPTLIGRWFVRSLEPPVKMRTKAPAAIRPRSTGTRDEILRAFLAAHHDLRTMVLGAGDLDLNRAKFPNPFVKGFSVRAGTGLRVINAHDRRHLWQAEQVTRLPEFPR